jgi:hypothetical protein
MLFGYQAADAVTTPLTILNGCVARTLDDDAKSEIRADPASRYAAISKRLATKAA